MSAVTTLLFFLMPIIIACISLMLNKYVLNTSKNALKLTHFSCTKYDYEDMLSCREVTCLLFFNSWIHILTFMFKLSDVFVKKTQLQFLQCMFSLCQVLYLAVSCPLLAFSTHFFSPPTNWFRKLIVGIMLSKISLNFLGLNLCFCNFRRFSW